MRRPPNIGLGRATKIVVMAEAVVVCLYTTAAFATTYDSFSWTAHFNSSVRSRDYTCRAGGTHRITSSMQANGDPASKSYRIEVSRNRTGWPDVDYGAKSYTADQGAQTRSWSIGDTGNFHFTVRKINTSGVYWDGSGTTRYPSTN